MDDTAKLEAPPRKRSKNGADTPRKKQARDNGDAPRKKPRVEKLESHWLDKKFYEQELIRLQFELVKLQYWVIEKGLRVVIIFEGRDAAGKGGLISRIIEPLNPRGIRLVALGKPSDVERT